MFAEVTAYEHVGQRAFGDRGRRLTAVIILLQVCGCANVFSVASLRPPVCVGVIASELRSHDIVPGYSWRSPSVGTWLTAVGGGPGSLASTDLLVSWPQLIRDVLTHLHVTDMDPWATRTFLIIAMVVVVVLPLVCARHLGFLGYSSGVSITIMAFFSLTLVIRSFDVDQCPYTPQPPGDAAALYGVDVDAASNPKCDVPLARFDMNTFYVLPTLAFSFVCHTSLLPIYTELKQRSMQRMMKVSHTSVCICFSLYLICGIFGLRAFKEYVLVSPAACTANVAVAVP